MLLTARLCLEKGYHFSIACPRCTTVRVVYRGLAERVIAKGLGDQPLVQLFERGVFTCKTHRTPAVSLTVGHDRDSTVDEIARWRKKGPAQGREAS